MMTAAGIALRLGLRRYPRSWRGRCSECDYPSKLAVRAGRDGAARGLPGVVASAALRVAHPEALADAALGDGR